MTNVINNNERRKFYGIYILHQQVIHQLSQSHSYWYSFRFSFVDEVLMMAFSVCSKKISVLNIRSTLHICDRNMAWNQFFLTLRPNITSKQWSTDDKPQHFFPLSKCHHVIDWMNGRKTFLLMSSTNSQQFEVNSYFSSEYGVAWRLESVTHKPHPIRASNRWRKLYRTYVQHFSHVPWDLT